jgi:hypothetical protein
MVASAVNINGGPLTYINGFTSASSGGPRTYIKNLLVGNGLSNAGGAPFRPLTHVNLLNAPPLAIAGCTLWLDGADPLNTGVPPPVGSYVVKWVDKSSSKSDGFSAPVVPGTSTYTRPPKFTAAGVEFEIDEENGLIPIINLQNGFGAGDFTLFIVVKPRGSTDDTASERILTGGGGGGGKFWIGSSIPPVPSRAHRGPSGRPPLPLVFSSTDDVFTTFQNPLTGEREPDWYNLRPQNLPWVALPPAAENKWFIGSLTTKGFGKYAMTPWANGIPQGKRRRWPVVPDAPEYGIQIGGDYDGERPFTGTLGGVLVYNRALADAERTAVEKFLSAQWGVTYPGTSVTGTPTPEVIGTPPLSGWLPIVASS